MALAFIAAMTVAGGALVASRVISSKPGGARLYIQRKNIQLSHKFGMIDDLEAAASYEQLARHYEKLVRSRPLVLAEGRRAEVKTLYYTGPFKSEMTHREARQILGVTDAEAKDTKNIVKQWRSMMLKNHPDTGGSPYVAAKINEAKEIIMGEKPAKEGSEEEDEEEGSSDLDDDPETKEKKRKEAAAAAESAEFSTKAEPYDPRTHPDNGPMRDHPAAPYYNWKHVNVEGPVSPLKRNKASPRTTWNLKEDTFHRKATRLDPHFQRLDDKSIWPEEAWRDRYLAEQERFKAADEFKRKTSYRFVEDAFAPGTMRDENNSTGHWEDLDGNKLTQRPEFIAEYDLAHQMRDYNSNIDFHEATHRSAATERVKRMTEEQERRREAIRRANEAKQRDSF